MKWLVVGSPHSASTRDVWIGQMKGLALNGQSVQSFDVFPLGEFYSTIVEYVRERKIPIANLKTIPSPMTLAYSNVFMAAHHHEVDGVWFVSPQYLPVEIPDLLRKDGFKTVAAMSECPYEDQIDASQKAASFDTVFVNDLNSVEYWRPFNPNTHYLPHSYDPDKHFPSWDRPKNRRFANWQPPDNGHDHVVYMGSGFSARQKYLEAIDWDGIDLRIYGHWPLLRPFEGEGPWESALGSVAPEKESPLIPFVVEKMVENTFTARIYRGAAIGINLHRTERWSNNAAMVVDQGEAYSMGPRGVELAACGCFQISDERQEIRDVFGDSVPVASGPEHMGQLIRQYLAEPVKRRELAVRQREAIKGRTFENNLRRALELAA
jgi:hypothetical protein